MEKLLADMNRCRRMMAALRSHLAAVSRDLPNKADPQFALTLARAVASAFAQARSADENVMSRISRLTPERSSGIASLLIDWELHLAMAMEPQLMLLSIGRGEAMDVVGARRSICDLVSAIDAQEAFRNDILAPLRVA